MQSAGGQYQVFLSWLPLAIKPFLLPLPVAFSLMVFDLKTHEDNEDCERYYEYYPSPHTALPLPIKPLGGNLFFAYGVNSFGVMAAANT
jgi:hypothetical protein